MIRKVTPMTGSSLTMRFWGAVVLLAHACLAVNATEPGTFDGTNQAELEQRLSRLESMLSMESCDNVTACCEPYNSEPAVYAGYKFLFVKPQMKESFEATVLNIVTGQNTLVPLDYNFNLTPNVWFGFRTRKSLGARVTYWGFNHDGNSRTFISDGLNLPGATATTVIYPAAIIAPAPGDQLQTQNSLNVYTIDAEGTLDFTVRTTDFTLGGGLRYASTDQQMQAVASRVGFPIGQLSWRREFEGFGPTLSASALQPLFGGFSAIGNFRGSLLYGHKDLSRTVIGDVTPTVFSGAPIVSLRNADEVVAAGDLGLGLRYTTQINGKVDAFVQGTYEGQLWTEAGAPTLTFLGFQGIGLALGLSY
jgi:hypothetical protein